jgi:hypothetical protein
MKTSSQHPTQHLTWASRPRENNHNCSDAVFILIHDYCLHLTGAAADMRFTHLAFSVSTSLPILASFIIQPAAAVIQADAIAAVLPPIFPGQQEPPLGTEGPEAAKLEFVRHYHLPCVCIARPF